MKFSRLALILMIISAFNNFLTAADTPGKRANHGFYIMLNSNFHEQDFSYPFLYKLHQQENVEYNEPITTIMAAIGLVSNIPISDAIVISGRVGINAMGGVFEEQVAFSGNPDTLTNQIMDFSLNYVEFSPTIQFHDFLINNLYVIAGVELGLPFLARFTHEEDLISPTGAEFPVDGKMRLYEQEVHLPDLSTRFAGIIGVGFTFPVGEKIFFHPEITYRYPIGQVSSSNNLDSWSVSQLRIGVAMTFDLTTRKKKRD